MTIQVTEGKENGRNLSVNRGTQKKMISKANTAGDGSKFLDTSCIYVLRLGTDPITLSIISSGIISQLYRRNILMINFQHYIQVSLSNTVFVRKSYQRIFSIGIIFIRMRLKYFTMTKTFKHAEGENTRFTTTLAITDHQPSGQSVDKS